jgi:predicted CXXCH cytochrome family protein
MRETILISLLTICYILIMHLNSFARVAGKCANCHTMHNSQNGTAIAKDDSGNPTSIPHPNLTIYSCLGCHSATSTDSWQDPVTGAPIVYNINGAPTYGVSNHGLAGGNFYWVKTDDNKGHNVFSDNPDDNLNYAPGKNVSCGGASGKACHSDISSSFSGGGFGVSRQGCTKCHMIGNSAAPQGYHHLNDTGPIIDSATEGWYRFLDGHMSGTGHGVSGIEDTDWQATYSETDHNEYLGFSGNKESAGNFSALGDTMTAYCCGCHGNFHIEQSSNSWIRHPSDAVIPNSGEYSAFTTYDPVTPVARPDLSSISDSGQVRPDTDMVMCLSCHKPHGSPYPDMLRWDYSSMVVGGSGSGGCFNCHTQKN